MAERRQELLESLTLGHEPNTYWRLIGQIQGLEDAVKISQNADFKISGDEPNVSA